MSSFFNPCDSRPKVAFFISAFGTGGVERLLVNLSHGLTEQNISVDLLVGNDDACYLDLVAPQVRVIQFDQRPEEFLLTYLGKERPDRIMTAKLNDDEIVFEIKNKLRTASRHYINVGTVLSERFKQRKWRIIKNWHDRKKITTIYGSVDGIIAVSKGVATDLIKNLRIPAIKVHILPSSIIPTNLNELVEERLNHPWFSDDRLPIVISVGRLSRVKDFPTLLRAFAIAREQIPCRLVILGDGRLKEMLLNLAEKLGISNFVSFPGLVSNPFAYLSRSKVFVLSSLREGMPHAMIEALSIGLPVVCTDCHSGPREILRQGRGRYGFLVPMKDAKAMSRAIVKVLSGDFSMGNPSEVVEAYTIERSVARYIEVFGLAKKRPAPRSNSCPYR